jgi:hypothetical protein
MMPPDTFWHYRWHSLHQALCNLRKSILEHPDDNLCREKQLFGHLLNNLETFAGKQFYFFFLGFGGERDCALTFDIPENFEVSSPPQQLEHSVAYPSDHVLRVTIDQISYDLTAIQQAWWQRSYSHSSDSVSSLKLADKLGEDLLKPMLFSDLNDTSDVSGFIHPTSVITYFQKSPSIRLIPYANIALVGIPYSATGTEKRDLLSLSHELGHYVYWHGSVKGKRLPHMLSHMVRDEAEYARNWIEEIFADIFGCLAWGVPAPAAMALDMIRDNATEHHVLDDGEHPPDAIRLTTYIEALRQATLVDVKQLDLNRRTVVAPAQVTGLFMPTKVDDASKTSFESAKSTLQRITEVVVDLLNKNSGLELLWQSKSIPFEKLESEETSYRSEWYDDFERLIQRMQSKQPNLAQQPDQENRLQSTSNQWFMAVRDQHMDIAMPVEFWVNVFAANGWTIAGPETLPVGG